MGNGATLWKVALPPALIAVVGLVGLYLTSQKRVTSVSIHEQAQWNSEQLEASGFPLITIEARAGNRRYVDSVSFLGTQRSHAWLEQMGFDIASTAEIVRTSEISQTGMLNLPHHSEMAVELRRDDMPLRLFLYFPDTGILHIDGDASESVAASLDK